MKKADFLHILEEIMELPPDTLTGEETLQSVPQWDSLAILGLIAKLDEIYGKRLDIWQVPHAETFNELFALLEEK